MKRLLFLLLWLLTFQPARADGPIYLPLLIGGGMAIESILRVTNGTDVIDLLGNESGWELEDPYWNPQIAQYKSGGSYVNSGLAEGQRLVHKEYDNVVETIPLSARGINQDRAIQTVRRLLQMAKQASDYWTKSYEYDDVWLEARPACNDCLTGYARVVKMSIPEIQNPFGQPFFSSFSPAVLDSITLVVEREPLWRGLPPGQLLGPMYNLLKNPDFELWNFGVVDSQPDSWTDLETLQITGQNSREATVPNSGQYALKIRVSGSTAAGKAKGVTQIAESTKNNTEYTVIAWVRSEGVSNGVGRILVTYSSQLEVYRASDRHGWTLYTGKFTTGVADVVSVNLEILTTAANTDGTIYIDSLMLLEGDFEEAAAQGTLPYMTSSHIVNHWDNGAGDINYVDVWNVPGDEDSFVRLEVVNNTTPADYTNVVETINKLHVGQRRTGNVQDFLNDNDPAGVADATCSNSDRVNVIPSTGWVDATTRLVLGEATVANNVGRFRLLARVYDAKASGDPTLMARLAYWMGVSATSVKTLSEVAIPTRAQWCMVNLTPTQAMITESKFRSNFPGALGYTVQLSRPTGSGNGYLDYVLAIPTDGGLLEAEINPGLSRGVALVTDNTASQSVAATGIRFGYNLKVNLTDYLATSFCSFNGNLYLSFASDALGGPNGGIWRKQGNTWTKIYSTTGAIMSLEVWNGILYALHDPLVGNVQLLQSSDGVSWSIATATPRAAGYVLRSYGGKLWLGLDSGVAGFLYSWDGSILTLEFTVPGGLSIGSLAEFNGRLYLGTGITPPGTIYSYSVATGWRLEYTSAELYVLSLAPFNGKLYAGTGGNGRIFSFDGSVWTMVHDDSTLGFSSAIQGMTIRDNLIIAARNVTGASLSILLKSEDGITWSNLYDAGSLDSMWAVYTHEGDVFLGVLPAAGTSGTVYTIVMDKPYEYSISDYQFGGGVNGGFTAPPRRFNNPRRHRWVFSFDRANGNNVISDQALIGLGYVPRYLTLRGAN